MQRILFLDIDGVLNNRESMMRQEGSIFRVNPTCVARLRRLVDDLDIKIVLSSTWRLGGAQTGRGLGTWRTDNALREVGWTGVPFIGHTPDLASFLKGPGLYASKQRGDECNAWIDEHGQPGDVYVAVDDDCDFDTFRGVLVRTEHEPGLTDANCERIRAAFVVRA